MVGGYRGRGRGWFVYLGSHGLLFGRLIALLLHPRGESNKLKVHVLNARRKGLEEESPNCLWTFEFDNLLTPKESMQATTQISKVLLFCLLSTTQQTRSPCRNETSLLTLGGVPRDSRRFTDMLMITCGAFSKLGIRAKAVRDDLPPP